MQRRMLRAERPWQEHAALYRCLFGDRAVAERLCPREAPAAVEARAGEILAGDISHWHERSFGPWVFFESATGMFIGRGGLHDAHIAGRDCVELLYAVRFEAWGRGYATEMATLAVAEARRLGFSELVGVTSMSNHASRRVLEKAGIRFEQVFERAGLPHLLGRMRPMH
jgi:[ribosomal protein S5]-alanine N-acetyltransferase